MALRDEILALPAELLAQRRTQAIADALPAVPILGRIERAEFAIWAARTGMRAKIEDHTSNLTSPLRSMALVLRDTLQGAAEALDFSITENTLMLDAWVDAGELSRDAADDLLARATRYAPVDEMAVRRVCWSDNGEWIL